MRVKNNNGVESSEKMGKVTTIQISIGTHAKLCKTAERLQVILHKKKVTPDQVIAIMYETNPLDVVLRKLIEQEQW